jgi:DNA-binding NarL/FixJ family response regulator
MSAVKLARVMIIDDDPFIRSTMESALKSSGFETSVFATAREAIASFDQLKPEIALLELDLGIGPTGIDLAHALRKLDSKVGIIFLTTYLDPRFADVRNKSLPQGARYLVKSEVENIAQVISVILQTKHRPYNENINHMNKYSELTDLQIEIWKAVTDGYSSAEIADQRGISEKAVEATLARIYLYLGIRKDKTNNPRILLVNAFKAMSGKV